MPYPPAASAAGDGGSTRHGLLEHAEARLDPPDIAAPGWGTEYVPPITTPDGRPLRAVSVDFDGTALTSDGELTPEFVRSYKALREAGVAVIPATGRPWDLMAGHMDQLGHDGFVVLANGAEIRDLRPNDDGSPAIPGGKIVAQHLISAESLQTIRGIATEKLEPGARIGIYRPGAEGKPADPFYVAEPAFKHPYKVGKPDLNQPDVFDKPGLKVVIQLPESAGLPNAGKHIADVMNEHAGHLIQMEYSSSKAQAEATSYEFSKATGVSTVLAELGVRLNEAGHIGDQHNDRDLFRLLKDAGGIAVVMRNGNAEVRYPIAYVRDSSGNVVPGADGNPQPLLDADGSYQLDANQLAATMSTMYDNNSNAVPLIFDGICLGALEAITPLAIPETGAAPKLLATDLDETGLGPDGKFSPGAIHGIHRMHDNGVLVTLSSGRPLSQAAGPFQQLRAADTPEQRKAALAEYWRSQGEDPADHPDDGTKLVAGRAVGLCVLANGAIVFDTRAGKIVKAEELSTNNLASISDALDIVCAELDTKADFVAFRMSPGGEEAAVQQTGYVDEWGNENFPEIPRDRLISQPAFKLMLRVAGQDGELMASLLNEKLSGIATFTPTAHRESMEVTAYGMNKVVGLREVAERYGIDLEECAAAGDTFNDGAQVASVGLGIVVRQKNPAKSIAGEDNAHKVSMLLNSGQNAAMHIYHGIANAAQAEHRGSGRQYPGMRFSNERAIR